MFNNPFLDPRRRLRRQSSALVITLASLVLISALIIVFFQQSVLNRQISFTSAGQNRADLMAQTALDTVTGDLRREMVAGSTLAPDSTSSGTNIYIPTANFTATPSHVSDQGFPNLVKQSASGLPFWPAANYTITAPTRSVASNRTDTASLNGRSISLGEWNRPGLLDDPGTGSSYPQKPAAAYTAPDWVIITRQGPLANAAAPPTVAQMAAKTPSNLNYAVGRYAYTIYDEGGLLDVNLAGFPSSLSTTDFASKRGLLQQVDLSQLADGTHPSQVIPTDAIDALIQWRNAGTLQAPFSYTNYVFNATNGFTSVAEKAEQIRFNGAVNSVPSPGDQAFLNRQDLIKYVQAYDQLNGNTAFPTRALQYLGTSTRALNAPTYAPVALNPNTRPPTQGGAASGQDDLFNPSLINTRVTSSIAQRFSDGTPGYVGEPLIKYRFPLSRLGWFANSGLTGISSTALNPFGKQVTSADMLNFFGLTATTTGSTIVWSYNHGSANSILTLSQVAGRGREPDFFELLQAGMTVGSLGDNKVLVDPSNNLAWADPRLVAYDKNIYYQVIQIGANLIDQYDSDSIPTRIFFDRENSIANHSNQDGEFDGIENLPYLTRVFATAYRYSTSPKTTVGMWFQPEVWNPHAQPATRSTTGIPSLLRYIATVVPSSASGVRFSLQQASLPVDPNQVFSSYSALPAPSDANTSVTSKYGLQFTYTTDPHSPNNFGVPTQLDNFTPPTPLQFPVVALNTAHDSITDGLLKFVGVWIADIANASDSRISGGPDKYQTAIPAVSPGSNPPTVVTHDLQYWNGSVWITYDRLKDMIYPNEAAFEKYYGVPGNQANQEDNPATCSFQVYDPQVYDIRPDPRTDRFGAVAIDAYFLATTLRPNTSAGVVNNAHIFAGAWSDNLPTSASFYNDSDSLTRPGDGAYANGGAGYPLAQDPVNVTNSKPVILNRSFRSVADMGYAFRGQPFKHLDFFTSKSPDAALLDLFCLNEAVPTTGTAPPVAGFVNLNSRQVPVLQTVLSGAINADDAGIGVSTTISAADAKTLATSIVNLTSGTSGSNGPLLNRSELATRVSPLLTYSSPIDTSVKTHHEAAIRALSTLGDTRTWNLLIDVIAQSGQYTSTSVNYNQFVVAGEKRYWLHVAIDRYTGAVIAQSLEPVNKN